jgi:hypothetical protein
LTQKRIWIRLIHMKKTLLILTLTAPLLFTPCAEGASLDDFINATHQVEASGSLNPPDGRYGEIGPFQITEPYWIDSGVKCTFQECRDYNTAIKVMIEYFKRYEHKALLNGDYESLARLHNSGPGWAKKKHLTDGYWAKVKKNL